MKYFVWWVAYFAIGFVVSIVEQFVDGQPKVRSEIEPAIWAWPYVLIQFAARVSRWICWVILGGKS